MKYVLWGVVFVICISVCSVACALVGNFGAGMSIVIANKLVPGTCFDPNCQ